MRPPDITYDITKSQILAGLQCEKRLWLEVYHPEAIEEPDDQARALKETGKAVGDLARRLFPDGNLIFSEGFSHEETWATTHAMIQDPSVTTVFDASLVHDGINVRIPILTRVGENEFDIISTNSAAEVKAVHVMDAALQAWVAQKSGLNIRGVHVLSPNKGYVHTGDYKAPDPRFYFEARDITEEVQQELPGIQLKVEALKDVIRSDRMPVVDVGSHCSKPHDCVFSEGCHKRLSANPISDIPHISAKLRGLLRDSGISDISNIPDGFIGLSDKQRVVRDVVLSGKPKHNQEAIDRAPKNVKYPLHFFDIEAAQHGIPLFKGTRPYQTLPFQWSCHTLAEGGEISHKEYLHRGKGDPRFEFARSFIDAVKGEGSIFVYSSYEATNFMKIAKEFPELKSEIEQILPRLVDLLPIVKENLYYEGFHGSYSIKSVLPVLVPELSYNDLDVRNGAQAALLYTQLSDPYTLPAKKEEIATGLLKYCERDTEAMLRIFLAIQPHIVWENNMQTTEDQIPVIPAQTRNYYSKRDASGRFTKSG